MSDETFSGSVRVGTHLLIGFKPGEVRLEPDLLGNLMVNKVKLNLSGGAGHVFYPDLYGADPTGALDSTAAIVAALAAMPTKTVFATPPGTGSSATYPVGTLILGGGTYKVGSTADIGNIGPFVSILGQGSNSTKLNYRGSGDCIRSFCAIAPSSDTFDTLSAFGSVIDGFTIDGTNSTGTANGLHMGDQEATKVGPTGDLFISNFAGGAGLTGSKGLYFDNTVSWTENVSGRVNLYNCTNAVYFDVNGGDTSFEYNDLTFKIYAFANQNGVVLNHGALYANGSLKVRGNFQNGVGSNAGACIVFGTSSAPNNSLRYSRIDIQAETNTGALGGTIHHQTINFTTAFYSFQGCVGVLAFGNTWTATNRANTFFDFIGTVLGDTVLDAQRFQNGGWPWLANKLCGWSFDPGLSSSTGNLLSAGAVTVVKVMVPATILVTNIICRVEIIGNTLTAGACFAGIYSSDGQTLLGQTADQSATWSGTTGSKTMALTAPITIVGGPGVYVYVAYLSNGTTQPSLTKAPGTDGNQFVPAGAAGTRFARLTSTLSTLPPTITLASLTSTFGYWAGLS